MKKIIILGSLFLSVAVKGNAQDLPTGFKNWLSIGTEVEINKKLTLEVGQLFCLNTAPYELQFSELSVASRIKLAKRTYLLLGIDQFFFKNGSSFDLYHKFSGGVLFRNTFGLPIKQSIEVEYFAPQQKKHRLRGLYTATYSPKVKFLPWKGRPFVKGQLYYYYGGVPLTYYDENGETLAKQSPNDLHRFRLLGGIVFNPTKHWDMTLYYGWNKEFNTPFFDNRDLNIPSKNGSKIKYPFNDYTVLGLSFTYQLKLQSNDRQKSTKKNNHSSGN